MNTREKQLLTNRLKTLSAEKQMILQAKKQERNGAELERIHGNMEAIKRWLNTESPFTSPKLVKEMCK